MKKENIFKQEIRLLGFTQAMLAEELGVSPEMVSLWCTGKRLISARMVTKLLSLGVTKKAIANPTKNVEV